jgi:hypothetical protein
MYPDPSSLDTQALAACLRTSAGEERERQVDFLRYLDPFDAREAWREAGYGSLWQFCLSELALREGAAGRRIGAMRVLRQFPGLEAPLRDGPGRLRGRGSASCRRRCPASPSLPWKPT